jgi:hypothetical protein
MEGGGPQPILIFVPEVTNMLISRHISAAYAGQSTPINKSGHQMAEREH